jgi:uncharacterized OsmC-like protein
VADGRRRTAARGEAGRSALFLAGVAACGVELLQVLAKDRASTLRSVEATIEAVQDPARRTRDDVSTFTSVRMAIRMSGVSTEQAEDLVARFRRR